MLINKQIVRIMKLIKKIARRVLRQELNKLDSDVRYYREKAYGKQDVILPTLLVDGIVRMLPDPNEANRNPMVIKQNSRMSMGIYELSITEFHPGVGVTILVEPLHIRITITHRRDKLQASVLGCNLDVDTFCWDLAHSGLRLVDDRTFAMIADFGVSSVIIARKSVRQLKQNNVISNMKTTHNPPLKAKCKYRKFLYEQGVTAPVKVACEVLEETERQYKIRLLEPCDNYPVRWELWVKKYNIELAEPKVTRHMIIPEHFGMIRKKNFW